MLKVHQKSIMYLSLLFVAFLYSTSILMFIVNNITNQPPPPLDNHPCLIAKWGWPLLDCFIDRNVSSLYDSTFVTQAQSMMIVIIPTNFQNQIVYCWKQLFFFRKFYLPFQNAPPSSLQQ